MDRLNQCGEQREVEVSQQIELARASIRSRREEIKHLTDDRKRKVAGGALLQEVATLRRGIIEVAETLATEGVREFANCLLTSNGAAITLAAGLHHTAGNPDLRRCACREEED